MNLGENIYRFRTEKNMSQGDLADALDVSRQSVSKWENNSATPELEKLIKMSSLFGISLDELVSGKAPQPCNEEADPLKDPVPKVINIEKTVFSTIKRQYIIGIVILFCTLIYAIILHNRRFDVEEMLFMVFPVAACGVVYLFTAHPLFYCGWLVALGYWLHFFILFHQWEEYSLLIILGVAFVATMAIRTIYIAQNGIIKIPAWLLVTGGIVLLLLLCLLAMNTVTAF